VERRSRRTALVLTTIGGVCEALGFGGAATVDCGVGDGGELHAHCTGERAVRGAAVPSQGSGHGFNGGVCKLVVSAAANFTTIPLHLIITCTYSSSSY